MNLVHDKKRALARFHIPVGGGLVMKHESSLLSDGGYLGGLALPRPAAKETRPIAEFSNYRTFSLLA